MLSACLLIGFAQGLSTAAGNTAASNAEVLAGADRAFRAGIEARSHLSQARPHFAAAAAAYELLHQRGFRSVALYRNQGNAYFLAGDLARALLAYERGLRTTRDDRQFREELE